MISKRERRWLGWFSAWAMLFTVLPYLLAYALTPPGTKYLWLLYNPDEPNVHLAWMRQAWQGKIFFIDPFTTEPQKPMFFHALFLALGVLARVLHLPLIGVYHGFRFIAGVLLLHSVYWLTAFFFRSVRIRKTAVWTAVCSSGWGWLAFALSSAQDPSLFGLYPVDVSRGLMMPEGFTFPSLLLYPLFTFSMFLMVCCFLLMARGRPVGAGVCGLLLGNIHTYNLLVVYVVLAAWVVYSLIWRGLLHSKDAEYAKETVASPAGPMPWHRHLTSLLVFCALSCPGIVYQFFTFHMNPVFQEKALTLTPPRAPLDMMVSYGFTLLLAIGGGILVARSNRLASLLVVWLVLGSILIYLPVSFSRKMIEGLHIPMSVLAGIALVAGMNVIVRGTWFGVRRCRLGRITTARNWITGFALAAMALSNAKFLHLVMEWVIENNASRSQTVLMPPYYLPETDLAAAAWLAKNAPDATVLCQPFMGSYLPSLTGNKVYVGHWAETLQFGRKVAQLQSYLNGQCSLDAVQPLTPQHGRLYLLLGTYERALAPGFVASSDWREVFRHGDTVLYKWGKGV